MFTVTCPRDFPAERSYAVDVIFKEFLALPYVLAWGEPSCTIVADGEGKSIRIPDVFFAMAEDDWLSPASLPKEPLTSFQGIPNDVRTRLVEPVLPAIFSPPDTQELLSAVSQSDIEISLDIIGSVFFMLSRYEECLGGPLDAFGRFPATSSLAFRAGFLDRPIVDEYVEVLWACMTALWPRLERPRRKFEVVPTHDVDSMVRYWRFMDMARSGARDIQNRGRPDEALRMALSWAKTRLRPKSDPWYTFPTMIKINEAAGLKGTFFFLTDRAFIGLNSNYSFDHPLTFELISALLGAGQTIGLHPTFEAATDVAQMRRERSILAKGLTSLHADTDSIPVRQHYLNVRVPETLRYWNELHFAWDTSLGYADVPGFRCGTCHPFPLYDVGRRERLSIWERPLIAMDGTVLDSRYMGLRNDPQRAFDVLSTLKDRCRRMNGEFVVLWHNTNFEHPSERDLYASLLGA